ncbi:hypothetical protein K435DRAFT_965521 [Dendrothele bispora CBS 962.96]|uniref:Uncharacterized protein n=1 Tax=Dendrothele bispora (strain CBS 962.96) TaxID=1314807 RepID=A0A4S8M554_DENBC|nr:hypothetical protein K435DRAFT_965521 [Dendrothele bispora CBS 962.96]
MVNLRPNINREVAQRQPYAVCGLVSVRESFVARCVRWPTTGSNSTCTFSLPSQCKPNSPNIFLWTWSNSLDAETCGLDEIV